MKKILHLAILLLLSISVVAQDATEKKEQPDKKEKTKTEKEPYKFNPSVGAGVGATSYYGDIEDVNSTNIHRLGNRLAYDFSFKTNISRCFNLGINALTGKLSGNENEHREHRNFQSKFFSLGLNLEYNFAHFYSRKKDRKPFITPFISAGVYYADYKPFTDLYDGEGNYYHYWDNGSIHNLPENNPNPEQSEIIDRDYDYESAMTLEPVTTVAFPVAGGFDFHLGQQVTFRLSASYFFTLSDDIDGFSDKKYSKQNDGYYYNSIGLFFNFISDKKERVPGVDSDIYFVDFDALDEEDEDKDGVVDLNDNCGNTPASVKVDEKGCPLDTDRDGISDYLDKEPASKPGSFVDADGVTISFMKIAETAGDTGSMKRSMVNNDYIFSQKTTESQYTVHVATVGKNVSVNQRQKLNQLSGLVETKQDSLTVFTLGNFKNFEDAEKKQNELLSQGYDEAFAATPKAVEAIAMELEKREKQQQSKEKQTAPKVQLQLPPDEDVVKFKVQLTEYRLKLQVNKLADLMSREGVEMKTTTGGLKIYIIGAFDTFEQAQKIRKEILSYGVKEAEIVATINNEQVTVDEAKEFLKKQKK